ncbi:MAG: PA2778 family cysteine peptidase [Verrucomicrobiota bacterium]
MRRVFLFLVCAWSAAAADIPFIAQQPGQCGPAALAMLANGYGQKITADDIAKAIYLPDIHGTLTTDLADYAKRFDLWVRQYRSTQADLRQKLAAGVPMLVLGKFGDRPHYFIVLGFDDFAKTVIVHTDQRANYAMPQEQFWRVWDRADRWTLLVCPPGKATWELSAAEHNDLGIFLERQGKFPAAAGNYRRASELAPGNSYYLLNLGNALTKQQLPAEAAAAFRQALKVEPANADAMNNLADAYVALNANLDEAAALCERAVKLMPGHRAYYLDTLGHVLLKQGRMVDATKAFEQALAATTDRQAGLREKIRQAIPKP